MSFVFFGGGGGSATHIGAKHADRDTAEQSSAPRTVRLSAATQGLANGRVHAGCAAAAAAAAAQCQPSLTLARASRGPSSPAAHPASF
jgi:hypothetical protein